MHDRRATLLAVLALVLAVAWVYAPVRTHGWVNYDDPVYLSENPHVARGLDWGEAWWLTTHDYAANYHPLTWLSHMLDVELFGLEPGPHHLVNVALHALNAVLVFFLARALLERVWPATIAAALFALHPLRVESVAWASERKDVLCATFFLAALLAYLRYAREPSRGRYLLVCLFFVLALLAKPMAVTLPCVLLLLDTWPLRRWGMRSPTCSFVQGAPSLAPTHPGEAATRPPSGAGGFTLFREKIPLFALAALAALVTLWAQSRGGSASTLSSLPFPLRALNALASIGTYVGQTLWPLGLSVFYPHAAIVAQAPLAALLWPALLGLAVLVVLTWSSARVRAALPVAWVGWLAFLVMLLPVIGLVQVGTQAHADRYTYLPAVGLTLALVAAVERLLARSAAGALALGLALASLLAGLARQQLGCWESSETLFQHARALDGRNYLAHMKLGELALADGDAPRAAAAFDRALEIHPRFLEALNDRALCHLGQGELEPARTLLERALRVAPDDFDTWLNLGAVELERGDLAAARKRFEHCRERAPEDPDVLFDLAQVAQRGNDPAEAERLYRAVIARAPAHEGAWSNLAQVLLGAGRTVEAVAAFEHVLTLTPDDPLAHFNLGVALHKAGERERARASLQRALELEPGLELARQALLELDGER